MSTMDDLLEPTQDRLLASADDVREAAEYPGSQPPEIHIAQAWLPTDPARSIEAAVIAVFFVSGWLLALWAYVHLTR